jgi:hypothetical protein
MQKIKFTAILFLLLSSTIFLSCSSDDDANPVGQNTFIRYTVDGVTYEYSNIISAVSAGITLNGQIGADTDADYSNIAIFLPLDLQIGTYSFSGDIFQDGDYKLNLESNPLNITDEWAVSGDLTIDTVTGTTISGTFTATIFDDDGNSLSMVNGEFDAANVN